MTVEIPPAIMAIATTAFIAVVLALVTQFFDYKAFKKDVADFQKDTELKIKELNTHIEFSDKRLLEIKELLLEIKLGQVNHEKSDKEVFERLNKTLDDITNYLRPFKQPKD